MRTRFQTLVDRVSGAATGVEPHRQLNEYSLLDRLSRNSYTVGMRSVVSEKGQVTIPKAIRDRLGIRPGQILDFTADNGRLVATKTIAEDPIAAVYGILRLGRPTDELIRYLRGKADA